MEIKTNIQNLKFDTSKSMNCRGQNLVTNVVPKSEYIKKEYFEFRVRRASYLTMLQDHIDHLSNTKSHKNSVNCCYCNAMSILQPFNWLHY